MPRPQRPVRDLGVARGWRSGLEEKLGAFLEERGIKFEYETLKVPFLQPSKPRSYTPDYILPNGIIIESKGRFLTADRQKMKLVKEQHPDLDIRFVFSNALSRISKTSKTTYAKWAEDAGFPFAHRSIPEEWLTQPPRLSSLRAISALRGGTAATRTGRRSTSSSTS